MVKQLNITESQRFRIDMNNMGETLVNSFLDYIGMYEAYNLDPRLHVTKITPSLKSYNLIFHGADGSVNYSYQLLETRKEVDQDQILQDINYLKGYFNNRDLDDIYSEW